MKVETWLDRIGRPAVIGVVHVQALPGTPRGGRAVREIVEQAVREARVLAEGGMDAIILENMHDVPYLNRQVGPEITAAMTVICAAVRGLLDEMGRGTSGAQTGGSGSIPLGVQILAGANREAVAAAHAAGCQFVRCEGFVFAHVADEGLMAEADAGPLLRYRRMIGAEEVAILADVKKKHAAHAMTADVDLAATARAAEFFGADGVIVTGAATGEPTTEEDVAAVRTAVKIPVFVGSGVTVENAAVMARSADGLIVGSSLKRDGFWANDVDAVRVRALLAAVRAARE